MTEPPGVKVDDRLGDENLCIDAAVGELAEPGCDELEASFLGGSLRGIL